ncbi:hypothetical protein SAMN05660831_01493 [Thiohalospira halophila DSM 15071]|uniref:DUF5666 domain-containing protein n=1 Tax=Thiohalospira halophila DSM 15071 TaxID=1123397 RepID=A0A1I1RKN6_9GAMM|nr:DUF5666 domain-containing protein [Thiohalospira halophila]SFD34905.1 hypothetical protein SAMN05660831_01493 [Thiohalospira halophila DSM 15071]
MMPRLPRSAVHKAAIPLFMTLLAIFLAACVPQEDTTIAGNQQNDGGISGTGYSSGPVDGFGSIYVNGIRYATGDATLYIDGAKSNRDEREALGVGMVVTVTGNRDAQGDSGTAETVRYRPLLRGPVADISLDVDGLGSLTVLGRTVIIDRGTVFADRTGKGLIGPEAITTEQAVEVSGYPEGNDFRATRLAVLNDDGAIAVSGSVETATADTVTLQSETEVRYGTGTDLTDLPAAPEDWSGRVVHIRGNHSNGGLQADAITGLTGLGLELPADEDGEVEATGRVTSNWDESTASFGFNGARVTLTDRTEFEDSRKPADLKTSERIELEAEYRDGTLTAEEIEFLEEPTETAFEGALEAVGSVDPNGRVTHLTLFGVEMAVTPRTRLDLDDEGGALTAGDCVEVLLRPASNQPDGEGALALQLEREDDEGCEAEIEGTVTVVQNGGDTVVIAGVTVDLSGTGTSASVGDRLEVEGSWEGNTFQASEVEREDEEDDD